LEFDRASTHAVGGQEYILDKLGKTESENQQNQIKNYYRFLAFLREESRKVNRKKRHHHTSITEEVDSENNAQNATTSVGVTSAQTSAQAMMDFEEYVDEPTVVALPKLNMIITFSNVNDDIERIERMSNTSLNEESDGDYSEYMKKSNELKNRSSTRKLSENSNQNLRKDSIPFIDTEDQNK
jgi:hypothetical protein